MSCDHSKVSTGTLYGYSGSVYSPGITNENRAAAGGVTYTETCDACGAKRRVNSNGLHEEVSAWSASKAARLREHEGRRAEGLRAVNEAMAPHGLKIDRLERFPTWCPPAPNWSVRVLAPKYERGPIVARQYMRRDIEAATGTGEQRALWRELIRQVDSAARPLSVEWEV